MITSPIATLLVATGHIYHTLFFEMSAADIYHHVIFAAVLVFINIYGNWGVMRLTPGIVLCGFPGIFEYLTMVLYKLNHMNKVQMRGWVTLFHLTLRVPLWCLDWCKYGVTNTIRIRC